MVKKLHKSFGDLLYRRFVSSFSFIYLFSHLFMFQLTPRYLFYTLGYHPNYFMGYIICSSFDYYGAIVSIYIPYHCGALIFLFFEYFLSFLIALDRTSSMMFHINREKEHSCLILKIRKSESSFSPLNMMLATVLFVFL